jgi:hypothetical protein
MAAVARRRKRSSTPIEAIGQHWSTSGAEGSLLVVSWSCRRRAPKAPHLRHVPDPDPRRVPGVRRRHPARPTTAPVNDGEAAESLGVEHHAMVGHASTTRPAVVDVGPAPDAIIPGPASRSSGTDQVSSGWCRSHHNASTWSRWRGRSLTGPQVRVGRGIVPSSGETPTAVGGLVLGSVHGLSCDSGVNEGLGWKRGAREARRAGAQAAQGGQGTRRGPPSGAGPWTTARRER